MKTYFIFSDIHGHFSILMDELLKQGFDINNINHIIISLGDNFDRGNENDLVLQFLNKMYDNGRAILILGNHEDLIKKYLEHSYIDELAIINGTANTIYEIYISNFKEKISKYNFFKNFTDYSKRLLQSQLYKLICNMYDYFETDRYIFTHGFIPVKANYNKYSYINNWRDSTTLDFYNSRWLDGRKIYDDFKIYEDNKKIVIGHMASLYPNYKKKYGKELDLEKYDINHLDLSLCDIYANEKIICIDTFTIKSKKINILKIKENDL